MKKIVDEHDKAVQDEIDKLIKENEKISNFKKMMPYTHPKLYIILGPLGSLIVGSFMPIMGVILSYMLSYLVIPMNYLKSDDGTLTGKEFLKQKVNLYSFMLLMLAFISFVFKAMKLASFGKLG